MNNSMNDYMTANNADYNTSTLMTSDEVADYLKIGKNRTYELLRSRKIKAFRIGTVWRVSKQAIDDYIREASGMKK
ncbi:helix-turn-helix domain-containing protein [[Clostridium] fimetarium]|uniref:DNA binding domain-containing protein, excisionase family n=1 Tax=[Clostridium] fimetarium TaxID=99656 RepID=A0A1I0Q013_9FIRM|nr:helix-turn-helix domain-containing protein [[Clostridium] fimetarium]SEW20078.1 DNA binding domain-containing protein, excisionase family [[Clostridium] fimetarium]